MYTTCKSQDFQNVRHHFDSLVFKDNEDWNQQQTKLTKLLGIVGKMATYDEDLSDKDKIANLLRSLPNSFASLAMVSNITGVGFD